MRTDSDYFTSEVQNWTWVTACAFYLFTYIHYIDENLSPVRRVRCLNTRHWQTRCKLSACCTTRLRACSWHAKQQLKQSYTVRCHHFDDLRYI